MLKHLDYHNESTDYIQERNSTNYQIQRNVCNNNKLSYNLLSNNISYIVLAAIVNILLLFKMDHLFGKVLVLYINTVYYIILYNIKLILSNILSFIVRVNYTYYEIIYSITIIFQNIVLPYFIMMLGRSCIRNDIQEPQGSPLIATLILCNIKPVVTYRLTRAISILTSTITDLALYIFSFTLIYCAITYYLQDFNILIASSM